MLCPRRLPILPAALVLAFAVAPSAGAADFRGISWGMSESKVSSIEGANAVSEANLPGQREVVYKSWVAGAWATITYVFENDGLLSATYRFILDKDRRQYVSMEQAIIAASGAPTLEKTDLAAWRLPGTEIALTHRADGTTYAAFWEKSYFARINGGAGSGGTVSGGTARP